MDEVTRQAFFQELTLLEMQKEAWNPMPAVQGAWTAAKGLGQHVLNNPGQAASQAGGWLKKVTLDSAGQGLGRMGGFLRNPGRVLQQGWKGMTPGNLTHDFTAPAHMLNPAHLQEAMGTLGRQGFVDNLTRAGLSKDRISEVMTRAAVSPGHHTLNPIAAARQMGPAASLGQKMTAGAEALSRGGWTGQGNLTKYLPVGAKGMLAVGAVPTAIGMANIARGGSAEDAFGRAAGTVGSVAGTGLPFVGSTILGKTFEGAGRRLGTGVDWALHRGRFAPQRPVQPTGVGYNQQP